MQTDACQSAAGQKKPEIRHRAFVNEAASEVSLTIEVGNPLAHFTQVKSSLPHIVSTQWCQHNNNGPNGDQMLLFNNLSICTFRPREVNNISPHLDTIVPTH